MTNAELIKALRWCADGDNDCGDACPFYDKQPSCSMYNMMNDAADALERLMAEVDRKDKAIQGLLTEIERLQHEQQP